jgi:hypothetical protein
MMNTLQAIKGWIICIISILLGPFKKNWAESLQFVVVAFGIIISGYWAYHTFETLLQKEKAEAELELVQQNLYKAESELKVLQDRINGTISSNIEIDIEKINLENEHFGLIITIRVKNTGTQDVDMRWDKSPLVVYKTRFKGDKLAGTNALIPYMYRTLQSQTSDEALYVKDLHLFVGATKELSFFTEVSEVGLYYIAFEAKVDNSVANKLENGKTGIWLSTKYHYVTSESSLN